MKKINYIASLFMAFSAASTSSTAFAATETLEQIEKLTQEIIKRKDASELLESAQQLRLKQGGGVLKRSDFKTLVYGALVGRTKEDLSKPTNEIIEDLKEYIKDKAEINEVDDLEIMAREYAIRTNEHGKKKVRKSKEAAEVVKREERDEDISRRFEERDEDISSVSASEESPSSSSKAGEVIKREEGSDFDGAENPQAGDLSKPLNDSDQENHKNPQAVDSAGAPNNSDQENHKKNKKSAFKFFAEDDKGRSDTNNEEKKPSFFRSKRVETVIVKGDPSKRGKNAEASQPSKNNRNEESNARKSERTRKGNPKYSSD